MNMANMLPPEILTKATLRGKEYAWTLDEMDSVVETARSMGFASVGGQLQFRLPEGTCELYWLAADSTPRFEEEDWSTYVDRSASEVIEKIRSMQENTDFVAEGIKSFKILEQRMDEGVNLMDFLCFVAYFKGE